MSIAELNRLIFKEKLFRKQAATVFEIYRVDGDDFSTHLEPAFANVDEDVDEFRNLINIRIAVENMLPIGEYPPPFQEARDIAISFLQGCVGFSICPDSSSRQIVVKIEAMHVIRMDPRLQCALFELLDKTGASSVLRRVEDFESKPVSISKDATEVPSLCGSISGHPAQAYSG